MRSVIAKAFEQIKKEGKVKLFKSYKPEYGDGEQQRDFVYVKDVAEAIVNALEKENNIGEKYLVGNYMYKWKDINKMISEISDVPLPKFSLPNSVTLLNAYMLTGLANLIKKPPLWGMAIDQMKVMKAGFEVDGSKAERELGIEYTPIRSALQEAINSLKE